MTFAAELLRLRLASGRDRVQVAIEAHCTDTYLYWLEKGKRIPPITSKIKRICRAITKDDSQYQNLLNLLQSEWAAKQKEMSTVPRKNTTKTLSHVEFHRLCMEMHAIGETLTSKKPSKIEACRMLTERLKFPVSHHALEQAMEATNIKWERAKRQPSASDLARHQVTRILGNAILNLYKAVGEQVPHDLIGLVERTSGRIANILQDEARKKTGES